MTAVAGAAPRDWRISTGGFQRLVWLVVWLLGGALILENEASWQAPVALLGAIGWLGIVGAERLSKRLQQPKIRLLGYVHLLKIALVLALLYFAWTPGLDSRIHDFGYDAQRYYFDAELLQRSGFNPAVVPGINYAGILYYYGWIFRILGHNPASPALVNCGLTFAVALMFVVAGAALAPEQGARVWLLGLLAVIPEVVWYDVQTSRETLCMNLVSVCVLPGVTFLFARKRPFRSRWLLLCAIPLVGLVTVRTPFAVAAVATIMTALALGAGNPRRRLWALPAIALMTVGLLVSGPLASAQHSQSGYANNLENILGAANDVSSTEREWESRSVGHLLQPTTPAQVALFAPLRMLAYVAIPLPGFTLDMIRGLAAREWEAWSYFGCDLSALFYIFLLFPLALCATAESLWGPRTNLRAFVVPFLVFWLMVSAGTDALVDRYRIVMVPFIVAAAWAGLSSSAASRRRWTIILLSVLSLCGVLFVLYKVGMLD